MTKSDVKVPEGHTGVSYSQYTLWSTCPRQWKLRYIDGHKENSNINLVFGTAIHETVQTWLELYYVDEKRARTFDMHQLLKDNLMAGAKKELLSDGKTLTTLKEISEFYADGCNILDAMRKQVKDWFPTKGYELVGIEVPLLKDLGRNITFKGFIDIVVYHKSAKTLYIYDFKTSGRGWNDYQKKDATKTDQLLLYKMFYAELFGIPIDNIKVEFIILKRKVPENTEYVVKHAVGFAPSNGTPSMKKAKERFHTFLTEVFDDEGKPRLDNLTATPSDKSCKYCPFNKNADLCEFSAYLPMNKRKIVKK